MEISIGPIVIHTGNTSASVSTSTPLTSPPGPGVRDPHSLEDSRTTPGVPWQRHSSAAMAAADASRHNTTVTAEERERRSTARLFGRSEREPERARERALERERGKRPAEREAAVAGPGGGGGGGGGGECLVCGALFSSQEKLQLHAFCHTVEKTFHCNQPHCPKAFSSKYKLFRYQTPRPPRPYTLTPPPYPRRDRGPATR